MSHPPTRRLTVEPPHRRGKASGSRTSGSGSGSVSKSTSPFFPPASASRGAEPGLSAGMSTGSGVGSRGHDEPIELLDDEEEEEEQEAAWMAQEEEAGLIGAYDEVDGVGEGEWDDGIGLSYRGSANGLPSKSAGTGRGNQPGKSERLGLEEKEEARVQMAKLRAELADLERQIQPLLAVRSRLTVELARLSALATHHPQSGPSSTRPRVPGSSSGGASATPKTDYHAASFPWSDSLRPVLQRQFGLASFRLCQEGAVNAALDGRDVLCVMPTGGGKSLTYQLPAVLGGKGVTVVVSPLLALIWDQVRALKEKGIECAMLTGNTSKEEQNAVYRRMESGEGKEIRLCYVTPEKISKSKRFMSVLEKVNNSGRLKRFVIDEAHCCSQLGHDFRPDYKKLSTLKTLFPHVPIQAVTATLSNKTLPDLLKILRLKPITDGHSANSSGTVFFSSPLYRPNLKYQVRMKPKDAKAAIEAVGKWIEEHHPGESGIIYCLSKKDAETVAEALHEWSEGRIKTGVYHADVGEYEKEKIHTRWREGRVNVICATIAFGLGIDKGDVRYVIHHSMSKTLEGYYQETGRAGRDGKDSDCVLFYRGQDASRLSSLIYSDVDGGSKLKEMLRFAQDMTTCRKVAFAKYFSTSAHLSAAAWDHPLPLTSSSSSSSSTPHTLAKCGACDNCLRLADRVQLRDCTVDAWRVLRVAETIARKQGRVTLANLADIVRGLGGGAFGLSGGGGKGGGRQGADKGKVDVVEETGGKVGLNKEDTESLLIWLLLDGYLTESYSATAYAVNVYLIPAVNATRLTRLELDQLESGRTAIKLEYAFPAVPAKSAKAKKGSKRSSSAKHEPDSDEEEEEAAEKPSKKRRTAKTAPAPKKSASTEEPPDPPKRALAAFPLQPLDDSDFDLGAPRKVREKYDDSRDNPGLIDDIYGADERDDEDFEYDGLDGTSAGRGWQGMRPGSATLGKKGHARPVSISDDDD